MSIREVEITGEKFVVHEPDDVYDPLTGRALTGSWIWDSSIVLCHWLSANQGIIHNKSVLELGAGAAGLPGLMSARLGSTRVVLTDVAAMVPALRRNMEVNMLQDRVEVRELVWGTEVKEFKTESDEYNVVLMSDVLIGASEVASLGVTLRSVCERKREEVVVVVASEVRPWTGECLGELESQGFRVVELPLSATDEFCYPESGGFAVYRIVLPSEEYSYVGEHDDNALFFDEPA